MMWIKKVGDNCEVSDIECFPTVRFEHPATYIMMFHYTQYDIIIVPWWL
jgi:hypothetical protein